LNRESGCGEANFDLGTGAEYIASEGNGTSAAAPGVKPRSNAIEWPPCSMLPAIEPSVRRTLPTTTSSPAREKRASANGTLCLTATCAPSRSNATAHASATAPAEPPAGERIVALSQRARRPSGSLSLRK
jgi:hypothetical protein